MTTKEEKARLKSIRMLLVEIVQEVDEMVGTEKKEKPKKAFQGVDIEDTPKKDVMKIGDLNIGDESIIIEAEILEVQRIGDLNIGDEGIIIEGEILDIQRNTGKTKAGNAYEKVSVMLSDKSGPIKLVLWNEQVAEIGDLQVNDIIRVEAWKVEKGYKGGVHELVYGKFGTIETINPKIEGHII